MTAPTVALTPPRSNADHSRRLDFLDGVRGIGAALVVLQHLCETWFPAFMGFSTEVFSVGRVGVVAFFMVSGYVVGLTLSRQAVRAFAVRRFWRLFPVYWLATAAWIFVDLPEHGSLTDFGIFVIAANIFMIQGAIATYSILGVSWTLGIELAYYCQTALAKIFGQMRLSVYLGYFWLFVFAGIAIVNQVTGLKIGWLLPMMLTFASLGYSVFLRDSEGRKCWISLGLTIIFVMPMISIFFLPPHQSIRDFHFVGFNLSNLLGIAVFAFFYLRQRTAIPKILLWLGSVSYALYLVHGTVIHLMVKLGMPGHIGIPVVVILSLAAAWTLHKFVELPAIRLGRRLSGQRLIARPRGGDHRSQP